MQVHGSLLTVECVLVVSAHRSANGVAAECIMSGMVSSYSSFLLTRVLDKEIDVLVFFDCLIIADFTCL